MNTKVKKGIFWGGMVAGLILMFNVLHFILGGQSTYAAGPHERGSGLRQGGMGQQGGFDPHQIMNGSHHGGGFPWLLLFIGLAVLVLVVRWLRNRAKTSSMNQFIDTPVVGSHTPVFNQNARILDQWEKNLTNKKENE
ncbi:MAG: hypothetical protein K6T88_18625 [Bacillus sp. (in: Bacteria)]|nr:hypothetical protein [Bacillus sp. (in: firmicutes)]